MSADRASTTEPPEPTGPHAEPDDAEADAVLWLEHHGDALFRHACLRVRDRDAAEDLVQETLLAALQAQHRFQRRSSVRTWLFSILRHKIVDHYRRGSVRRDDTEGVEGAGAAHSVLKRFFTGDGFWRNAPSPWKNAEAALLDEEFRTVLDGCLARLPKPLAEAFLKRELDQVDTRDLCESLGLSPGNVRVRLHRARLLLRDCLEKHWFGSTADERPGIS
jgi:RNA polymerase sigma-70 factor (ECF subfamily)